MAKRVLITGGAGFLGSHVTDRAMHEGYDCYIVDNLYTGRFENLEHHVGHPRFHFVRHDVSNPFPSQIESLKFSLIFHLACAASPVHYQNDPIGTTLTCVNGTHNALKVALQSNCPILIASTSEVYGDPHVHPQPEDYYGNVSCTGVRSCYDEGKRCAEALCFDYNRLYGVKIRVARIFNTYGPRMCFNDGRIISNFLVQALQGDDITVYGTGEYSRSFQFYEDLVEGFWRLINHPTEIGPVNLGNPEEYTVLEMAQKAQALVPSTKSKIVFLPAAKDDPKQRRPDGTKAKRVLNWEPKVTVAEGLARTKVEFASRIARESSHTLKLYVQCNPLLDISAHVSKEFMMKYKVQPASAALVTPEQMQIFSELASSQGCVFIPGGSGLNTARVAQWMAQAPHYSFVTYVGCIADDEYGTKLKDSARGEGVTMKVEYTDKEQTGSCAVCIDSHERSLIANLGAAKYISKKHLASTPVQDALRQSKLFYLTGFTLTTDNDLVFSVAECAKKVSGRFCMNLSAPFVVQFFTEALGRALNFIDVLFANDDEAKAFAATRGWETTDVMEIAKKVAELPHEGDEERLVVFTRGKDPTVFATKTTSGLVDVPHVPVEKIVDTNGAGDAFVGGFLAAAAKGRKVIDCIRAGNYAAGVIIQHDGCTFPEQPEWTL